MNPSKLFIERPIATSLIMVALFLSGIIAYGLLPLSALPEVDYPTIRISTLYPGASPEVMTARVTAPLERRLGQIAGLNQMTSSSSGGVSVITLQFALEVKLDVAEQEVQAAINTASNLLPNDLPNPPIYSKVNPSDAPILTLSLRSKSLSLPELNDFVETRLTQRISQLSGVGLVTIGGKQRPAVRIQVNPRLLATYGLNSEDVRTAIMAANTNQAKGSFDGDRLSYAIDSNDQLRTSKEFKELIIAFVNNSPLKLKDVATVIDAAENTKQSAWMNTDPAVILYIQKQPGANVVKVAERVKDLLQKSRQTIPSDITLDIITDRTLTIRACVEEAQFELLLAMLLVIAVNYFFLRTMTFTLIPSIVIPLSLIGTVGAMYLMGFSLNNLTIMSLIIATGFVVDDAIVMIENISRYIENGETPLNAALKGSGQIAFTIISLTLSLIAVMIPLLFMGDVVGRLFREFALTLSVCILISGFISLTLTPMMCAHILLESPKGSNEPSHEGSLFQKVLNFYALSLRWVLGHQKLTLTVFITTVLMTGTLYYFMPKGFFPEQDTGVILGISEARDTISFKAMMDKQKKIIRLILEDPDIENVASFIGVDSANPTLNSGQIQINLKPFKERTRRAAAIIDALEKKVAHLEDISLYLQPLQDIALDDRISRTRYQVSVSATDETAVEHWSSVLIGRLKNLPEIQDVATNLQSRGRQTLLTLDRDQAARFNITAEMINDTLYNAFGQRQVSTIFTQLNQYYVILEALPEFQTTSEHLKDLYIQSHGKHPVPLSLLLKIQEANGPLVISRQGQFPMATLSFNLAPRVSLSDALKAIAQVSQEIEAPSSVDINMEGTAKVFQSALSNQIWLILAALVVVYIVLGILYESYIHPLTILSTLPSAGFGALLALILTRHDFSVVCLIGVILLIGIVKKNGILIVDFAIEQERRHHKNAQDAIFEASLLRFRPILMTTFAALFGAAPLAFGWGVGAEIRRPLGITLMGGLVISQVLTLYTTPIIYLFFDRLSKRLKMLFQKRKLKKSERVHA
ncbi:MAG: efflux RND transporter permease subunit [Alphaproteobacteria bacterium]|nr:efflux RND transporter permease subunit [Alphaproteobacteria bacterium]